MLIVGFFGIRILSYNSKVYITEIRLTNEELQTRSDGSLYMVFEYKQDLTVPFTFEVYPDNATERNAVEVLIVSQSDTGVAEFVSGSFLIYKPGSFTVRVVSTDGNNVNAQCDVYVRSPQSA